jgi:V-type H+-transporting ATPase subunit a
VKLTAQYFDEATRRKSMEQSVPGEEASLLAHEEGQTTAQGVNLGYVTGVINREKYASFERVMWRGTRGNVYMRSVDIDEQLKDPATGEMMDKVVFVAFFQGDVLAQKIKRICDGYAARYEPVDGDWAVLTAVLYIHWNTGNH